MFNASESAKVIGLVLTLIGAALTSFGVHPVNVYVLNAGAVFYLYWSWCVRDTNLMMVNGGLLLIYLAGLAKNLLTSS
jgi:hypothetical protein